MGQNHRCQAQTVLKIKMFSRHSALTRRGGGGGGEEEKGVLNFPLRLPCIPGSGSLGKWFPRAPLCALSIVKSCTYCKICFLFLPAPTRWVSRLPASTALSSRASGRLPAPITPRFPPPSPVPLH